MTCIIGMEFEDKVYMVGDRQGTGYNGKTQHTQPKVFEKGDAIFGYTSTYRWGQILETVLRDVIAPKDTGKTYEWICQDLVPKLMKACKDGEYTEKGNTCLIGINGQLWCLQGDWSVLRSVEGFDAVGSGQEYATGVLGYALKNNPPRTVKEVKALLEEAIKVTGTYCPSVGVEADIVVK